MTGGDAGGGIHNSTKHAATAGAPTARNGRRRPHGLRSRSLQNATGGLLRALTIRPPASASPIHSGGNRTAPDGGA